MCYRKKQSLTEPMSLCPADDVLQMRLSEGVVCLGCATGPADFGRVWHLSQLLSPLPGFLPVASGTGHC